MGTLFFLLVSLLAVATLFLEKGKRLLAAAKNSISYDYLALHKTCYDLVYMPIYRENYPLMEPYQGRPLHGLLIGLGVLEVPSKAPPTRPHDSAPLSLKSGPYNGPNFVPSPTPRRSRTTPHEVHALGRMPCGKGTWGVHWAGR